MPPKIELTTRLQNNNLLAAPVLRDDGELNEQYSGLVVASRFIESDPTLNAFQTAMAQKLRTEPFIRLDMRPSQVSGVPDRVKRLYFRFLTGLGHDSILTMSTITDAHAQQEAWTVIHRDTKFGQSLRVGIIGEIMQNGTLNPDPNLRPGRTPKITNNVRRGLTGLASMGYIPTHAKGLATAPNVDWIHQTSAQQMILERRKGLFTDFHRGDMLEHGSDRTVETPDIQKPTNRKGRKLLDSVSGGPASLLEDKLSTSGYFTLRGTQPGIEGLFIYDPITNRDTEVRNVAFYLWGTNLDNHELNLGRVIPQKARWANAQLELTDMGNVAIMKELRETGASDLLKTLQGGPS